MTINTGKIKKALELVYLVLLGFVAFSRISQLVIFTYLRIPFYLIEIFFIPLFVHTWREYFFYFRKVVRKPRFVFCVLILSYDIIAALLSTLDIVGTISMSRGLVYIVVITLLFIEKRKFSIDKLFVLSLAAMIGELIYGFQYSTGEIASINTSCLALMLFIPIIKKKYILFAGCAILGLIVSINSGYRIGIIVIIVAVFEGVSWTLMVHETKTLKNLLRKVSIPSVVLILITILVNNYSKLIEITQKWLGTSQFAIYRVTERLIGLFRLDFAMSREQERFDVSRIAIDSFWERVIPRGLVGESMGTLARYFDVPITILYDAFGSIGGLILLLVCVYAGARCFIGSYKRGTHEHYVVAGMMFPILLLAMFSNGSFMYITFQCITTGIILGEWFAYRSESHTNTQLISRQRTKKVVY